MNTRMWSLLAAVSTAVALTVVTPRIAVGQSEDSSDTQTAWRGPALMISGLAFFISGAAWQWQMSEDYATYDREFAELCPRGCVDVGNEVEQRLEQVNAIFQRADRRRTYALLSYIAGVGLVGTGVMLTGVDGKLPPVPRLGQTHALLIGTGLTAAVVGGVLQWRSSQGFAAFDEDFAARCPVGCALTDIEDLEGRLRAAERSRDLAFVSYVGGAALVITGLALGYRDSPRRPKPSTLSLVPELSPARVGMSVQGAF